MARLLIILLILAFSLGCKKKLLQLNIQTITSGTTDQLNGIFFIDNNNGYIVGGVRFQRGILLRTNNGGSTWTNNQIEAKMLEDVAFVDSVGFAVGVDGKIAGTTNGGDSWSSFQSPGWTDLHSIKPANINSWVAVGGTAWNRGVIHTSIDRGMSWDLDTLIPELRAIHMIDAKNGFAAGYGTIMKTANTAVDWEHTGADGDFFIDLDFPSASVGYAVGYNGSILKTTDGGLNWDIQRNPLARKQIYLEAVAFVDEQEGYAVGRKGVFLKTTNGSKWQQVETGTKEDLYDVWPFGPQGGLIVGTEGLILKYTN